VSTDSESLEFLVEKNNATKQENYLIKLAPDFKRLLNDLFNVSSVTHLMAVPIFCLLTFVVFLFTNLTS
jgi:hypothetical protein